MCILPADENATRRERILHIVSTIAIISIELCAFISSLVFFLKNVSIDLEVSLYAMFQMIAIFGLLYMVVPGLIMQRKMAAMFQTLSKIYDESEYLFEFIVFFLQASVQFHDFYFFWTFKCR